MSNIAEKAWDKVHGEGDPDYADASPDFQAKLEQVVAGLRQGQSSGIAGLEEFETEARKGLEKDGVKIEQVDPNTPRVSDGLGASSASGESEDRPSAKGGSAVKKGTGAQTPERALKSAAAAGARVEADEVHSPSFPSAARPLAAEAPGNAPSADGRKAATKRTKAGGKKSSAPSGGAKKSGKKSSKK